MQPYQWDGKSLDVVNPIDVDPEELLLDELLNERILWLFVLRPPALRHVPLYLLDEDFWNSVGVLFQF